MGNHLGRKRGKDAKGGKVNFKKTASEDAHIQDLLCNKQ